MEEKIAAFLMLLRATQDQATFFTSHVSGESKMRLNNYFNSGDRLVKTMLHKHTEEMDECIEDGAEFFIEANELLRGTILNENSQEALEALRKLN